MDWHVDRQSTDTAIESRPTYEPIESTDTWSRGAQIAQDLKKDISNSSGMGYQLPANTTGSKCSGAKSNNNVCLDTLLLVSCECYTATKFFNLILFSFCFWEKLAQVMLVPNLRYSCPAYTPRKTKQIMTVFQGCS